MELSDPLMKNPSYDRLTRNPIDTYNILSKNEMRTWVGKDPGMLFSRSSIDIGKGEEINAQESSDPFFGYRNATMCGVLHHHGTDGHPGTNGSNGTDNRIDTDAHIRANRDPQTRTDGDAYR